MNATTTEANPNRLEVSATATLRHSLVLLDAIVRNERFQVCRESERQWRWNVNDAAKLIAMMWSDSPDPQREAVRLLAVATKVAEREQCGQLDKAISYFTLRRAARGFLILDGMGRLPQNLLGSTGTGMTSRVIRPLVKPWLAENASANRKKKRR